MKLQCFAFLVGAVTASSHEPSFKGVPTGGYYTGSYNRYLGAPVVGSTAILEGSALTDMAEPKVFAIKPKTLVVEPKTIPAPVEYRRTVLRTEPKIMAAPRVYRRAFARAEPKIMAPPVKYRRTVAKADPKIVAAPRVYRRTVARAEPKIMAPPVEFRKVKTVVRAEPKIIDPVEYREVQTVLAEPKFIAPEKYQRRQVKTIVVSEPEIITPVEVSHFATYDGPLLEKDFESTQTEQKEAVTHHPVYHKNIYNQYTEHDVINRDVFHHLTEDEARHYDVAGKQIYVGEQHIDHGKVGHAAYGEILGEYGIVAPVIESPVETVMMEMKPAEVETVVVAAPKIIAPVEVENFASFEGPLLEKDFESTQKEQRETVTHHPVYHKNIYNQYTEHDVVNRDVFHHLTEDEARHYDVEGKQIYVGEQHIDHGKIGHAAYGDIVGEYGIVAPVMESAARPAVLHDIESMEFVRPGVAAPKIMDPVIDIEYVRPVGFRASTAIKESPVGAEMFKYERRSSGKAGDTLMMARPYSVEAGQSARLVRKKL